MRILRGIGLLAYIDWYVKLAAAAYRAKQSDFLNELQFSVPVIL